MYRWRDIRWAILLLALTGFAAGCMPRGTREAAADNANNAGSGEEARAARCKQEQKGLKDLDTDANTKMFATLPNKMQLTEQPYLKGKLLVLEARDDGSFRSRDSMTCRATAECERDSSNCSSSSLNFDKFSAVRARAPDEVQTVAMISCRKVKAGDYAPPGSEGKKVPGYDMVCELILVDRSIPAVIHKKTFKSELLMVENDTTQLSGGKELVARTPTSEMDSFLLELPRR